MSGHMRLAPVVLAVMAFPVVAVVARFALRPPLGPGTLGHQLVAEVGLTVVTGAIVAWAGWWRQSGLVGPWRGRWWACLAGGLLVLNLLVGLPHLLLHGDPSLLPAVLPLAAMVGFCEETLTRGVMLYGLSRFGTLTAGLITAGLFSLFHAAGFFRGLPVSFLVVQMLTAALLGLLFAALRVRMLSIWPLIVVHATFDLPALLSGFVTHVPPVGLFGAVISTLLVLPFGTAGLIMLVLDQLNGVSILAPAGAADRTRAAQPARA